MTETPLTAMSDLELRAAFRRREDEHIANEACMVTVRKCCNRSGEALRDVQAEIERRKWGLTR